MNAQYYTEIQLGTPAQTVRIYPFMVVHVAYSIQFKVILDTGYIYVIPPHRSVINLRM
jgi:hypothetical protein